MHYITKGMIGDSVYFKGDCCGKVKAIIISDAPETYDGTKQEYVIELNAEYSEKHPVVTVLTEDDFDNGDYTIDDSSCLL